MFVYNIHMFISYTAEWRRHRYEHVSCDALDSSEVAARRGRFRLAALTQDLAFRLNQGLVHLAIGFRPAQMI